MEGLVSLARRALALAVVAIGAYALYVFCVVPWRCNLLKKVRSQRTEMAFNKIGSPDGRIAARENVDALLACVRPECRDISLDMLLAANYRLLGQEEQAIRFYQHALLLDRRPEVFLNLGMTEIAAGNRAAARAHLLQASLFNVYMVASIEDGAMRQEIVKQLLDIRPENADFIRYADSLSAP